MASAKSYVTAYKKAFPGKQPGTWGTFTYDSARALFRAWDQAKDPFSYPKVLAKLRQTTNWQGATGKVTINKVGNRPNVPVSILTVDAGGDFDVMYTNRSTK
jgi:ABC-type branched-subunit amino acid transport system substrate-binding protein